jgi:hypothetical protein
VRVSLAQFGLLLRLSVPGDDLQLLPEQGSRWRQYARAVFGYSLLSGHVGSCLSMSGIQSFIVHGQEKEMKKDG